MDAPELVPFVRSVAEDMQKAGIQWRLDPAYLIQLCDLYAKLEAINQSLMGDDENAPRYTTKRLRQEIASATARLAAENERLLAIMRQNWNGSHWRAVGDTEATEVRAALTGGSDGE